VWNCVPEEVEGMEVFVLVEGMEEGFMREPGARGVVGCARALRISRSSKSSETSLILPSEGSLSDTSSMRACDMVVVVL